MVIKTHIPLLLLRKFANAQLGRDETSLVLRHLAECDDCLEITNAFWMALPENAAVVKPRNAEQLGQAIFYKIRTLH